MLISSLTLAQFSWIFVTSNGQKEMPREGHQSHEDGRRKRSERSPSRSRHHRHKHHRKRRNDFRELDRPNRSERTPRSFTHIYFNGTGTAASVSLRTDHVTLATNLRSLVENQQRKIDDILTILRSRACDMRQHLQREETPESAISPQCEASASSSSCYRGINSSNLVAIRKSAAKRSNSKPSFDKVMELCKITSLVPAADTKRRLHENLASHSEAKLESIEIPLFCPLTRSRIMTPVRGKNCQHIHCFDGESFCNLMCEKPVSKWKCPICKCHAPLSTLIVDGFIMEVLASVPENVRSVEFTSDGNFRAKESTFSQSFKHSSLALVGTSSEPGNVEVIDLTFDTPVKDVKNKNKNKYLNNSGNSSPQVIDLTLSP